MPAKHRRREYSSSEESDSSSEEVPKKKRRPAVVRIRLAPSRRTEVIQKKIQGIEDPEYSCSHNVATNTYTVRKRKFPLDQSPKLQEPIPKPEPTPVPEPVKEPPKPDLNMTWINMQATVNDSLKKELVSLSQKYDKLSSKYETKKKEKPVKSDRTEEQDERRQKVYRERPRQPDPVVAPIPEPPRQPPPPQRPQLRPGQYSRSRGLSISDF
jgi:hypothetical protein